MNHGKLFKYIEDQLVLHTESFRNDTRQVVLDSGHPHRHRLRHLRRSQEAFASAPDRVGAVLALALLFGVGSGVTGVVVIIM